MTIEIRKKYLGALLDGGDANYRLALKQGAIDGAADLPSPDSAKVSAWEEKFLYSSRAAWGSKQ